MTDDAAGASSELADWRPIQLQTSDGVQVGADLSFAERAWAGAVVCHPHPAYGGDRHNAVVTHIFRTLADAGVTVLRFDFRRAAGGGSGEQRDVLAGVERVAEHLEPDVPLWLVGYSFGADIALSVGGERVNGWVAVAPPLRFGHGPRTALGDPRPVLVVAAEHDQFNSPDRLCEAAATWPDAAVTVIPSADHFLVGAAGRVAGAILAWLRDRTSQPEGTVPPAHP